MRLGLNRPANAGRMAVVLLLVAAMVATLVAPIGLRGAAAQDIQTRMQVLHGATDLDDIEVHFNNEEELDGFGYGEISDWIDLDPGTVRVTITRDWVGFNYRVYDVVYPVLAGNDYYLVITDALVMASTADRDPVADGMARVRLTHASVGSPQVDVTAAGTDTQLASQLRYSATSEYVEIPAGTYDAEIRITDSGEVLATIPAGTVEAGKVYDFTLIGTPGSDDHPLTIVPLVDDVRTGGGTPTA